MRALDEPNYKITGEIESPLNLDYNLYGLHKKRTLIKGELVSVEYYKNFNGEIYSDLVVLEGRTYSRDAYNLVQHRTQISKWYKEDDLVGCEKTTIKFYTPTEAIVESETRRSNIVAQAQIYLLSVIGIENCFVLLSTLTIQLELYVKGLVSPLINAINERTELFMTIEIKGIVVSILTI